MQNGNAGYVLPRHQNLMYIRLSPGLYFGVSCIVGSFLDKDDFSIDHWICNKDRLKRQFTIQCKDQCELLTLNITDLDVMKKEFREAYMNLFENSFNNLRRTIQVKLKAIRFINKYMRLDTLDRQEFSKAKTLGENILQLTSKFERKK